VDSITGVSTSCVPAYIPICLWVEMKTTISTKDFKEINAIISESLPRGGVGYLQMTNTITFLAHLL